MKVRLWFVVVPLIALAAAPARAHDGDHGTAPFAARMDEAMAAMDRAMRDAPMTGEPDHDFASMMIPHHQGAIDMAQAELLYGKDPVLRRLAQEIVVTQGSEIAVMRRQMHPPARTHHD